MKAFITAVVIGTSTFFFMLAEEGFAKSAYCARVFGKEPVVNGQAGIYESVEWTFKDVSYRGNPFDIIAKAVFTHEQTGEKITTELYYDDGGVFKLRFTPTRIGLWKFVTSSKNKKLNDLTGQIQAGENPGAAGFVTNFANKWGFSGTGEAFVPQLVMYANVEHFYDSPGRINEDIKTFFDGHGFNGFHTIVLCRWFDLNKTNYNEIDSEDPNPDPKTFRALELLTTKVNAAGGFVHIWVWGDEQRKQTPVKWGINGKVDRRLQRYICARLGALPGWTAGYGFDLQEWVTKDDLRKWHEFMNDHLGWRHLLGGRSPKLTQIYDGLDYISYQQHRPGYETYVKGMEQYPDKPCFFEDRFRVRDSERYRSKDYNADMTRRGLWHSTMAGGAANIWGHLIPPRTDDMSNVYPNKNQILTYSKFWEKRFGKDMVPDKSLADGFCLRQPDRSLVFYKENADSIKMDVSELVGPIKATAVDTRVDYKEIRLDGIEAEAGQIFKAPYKSDWAIATVRAAEPVEKFVVADQYALINDRTMFLVGQMDAGVTIGRSPDELEKILDTMAVPYGMNLFGGNLGVIDWGAWNNLVNVQKGKEKQIRRKDYPWQLSGKGKTTFGLAKFDLDKFDESYFEKLVAVVKLANRKGMIPIVGIFSEHGIDHPLHWKGHPFHPQNNINQLGLPEDDAIPEFFGNEKALYYQTQYVKKLLQTLADTHYILLPFGEMKVSHNAYIERWLRLFSEYEKRSGKEVVVCMSGSSGIIKKFAGRDAVDMIDISYYHGGRYDDKELNVPNGQCGIKNTIRQVLELLGEKNRKPVVKFYFKYGYPYADTNSPWADKQTGTESGGPGSAGKDALQAVYDCGGAGMFFKMAWARDRGKYMKPDQWSGDIKQFVKKINLYDRAEKLQYKEK